MSNSRFMEQLLDGVEVEWKALGDVVHMRAGQYISASNIMEKSSKEHRYPCFGGNGIRGFVANNSHNGKHLLIGRQGALCGNVRRTNGKFYATEHAVVVTPSDYINIDFAFHLLTLMNLNQYASQSAQPGLSVGKIEGLKIPIPPLHIQAEIVRILDAFTELTTELTTELNARKKQYNYYRDQLLSFEEREIEWKTLGEITEVRRGRRLVKSQLAESGKYAVFQNSMTPLGYYHENNVQADTTFIISAGSAGEIGYSEIDFWAADDVYYFVTPENLQSKFLYYFLLTQQTKITGQVRRSSVPRLSKTSFEKMPIPVPSIEEQARIVAILDKFDALTNSLTEGLPREIALRQQQYAYYRDLLLSFPKHNPHPTSPLTGGGVG